MWKEKRGGSNDIEAERGSWALTWLLTCDAHVRLHVLCTAGIVSIRSIEGRCGCGTWGDFRSVIPQACLHDSWSTETS